MNNDQDILDRPVVRGGLGLRRLALRAFGLATVAILFALLGEATNLAGPLAPAAVILAGLLVAANALGYAELATQSGAQGGAYGMVHAGPRRDGAAFLTGWAVALAGLGLCALLAQSAATQLSLVLAGWGVSVPVAPLAMALLALAVVEESLGTWRPARWLLALPLVLVPAVLAYLGAQHQSVVSVPVRALSGRGMVLFLVAFVSLEVVTTPRRAVRRPAVVAWTFILTPLLSAIAAALLIVVGIHLVGPQTLAGSPAALATAADLLTGLPARSAVAGIGLLGLMMALRRALGMFVHHLYVMGQDGYWPGWLHPLHPRLGGLARLVLFAGALSLPVVWLPPATIARLGGLLYLLSLAAVNLTLALRPRSESGRGFGLPAHPWVPALVVAADLLVLPQWGWSSLGWAAVCLAAGGAVYLAYGRRHHVDREELATVFGPEGRTQEPDVFRVLVPMAGPAAVKRLLTIAGRLAEMRGGEVVALQVVAVPEPVPLITGSRRARAARTQLEKALSKAAGGLPVVAEARVARSVAHGIVDAAADEHANLILLDWRGPVRPRAASLGRVLDAVLREAPCDVLVVRSEVSEWPKRILVPTAGGPHAQAAAQLAVDLAAALDGEVTLLLIQRDPATPQQMEENRRLLANTVQVAEGRRPPAQHVVLAAGVVDGIVKEAEEHDLVLLGVSEESLFDRLAFGSVPLQVASRVPETALVQKYRGLRGVWLRRLQRALQGSLPALDAGDVLEVRQDLGRAAKPGANYFVLIVLSCIIAALGLLLNSPAVVIGAMLVAPLMSPIMAFSLGMVLGDVRLTRYAVEAILKGVALALVIAAFIGLTSPFKGATGEMLARAHPNLLDMAVALASGMAGAYALARKDVSAALPGVAIAAALMPPLATVGLALAMGDAAVSLGAFLLFVTNISAISLAGAIVFLLLGIHPLSSGADVRRWLQQRLGASIVILLLLAVPLGLIMRSAVREATAERLTREAIARELEDLGGELAGLQVQRQGDQLYVVATLRAEEPLDQPAVDSLAAALGRHLGRPVRLEVVTLPVVRGAWSDGEQGN